MLVTRASRHDKADLKEFVESIRGEEVDTSLGTAMIAREGAVIGCIRLVEVADGVLVYDDLLVAPGRDGAVAKQLVQAALNNRGGTVYAALPEDLSAIVVELGFSRIDRSECPPPVAGYWEAHAGSQDLVYLRAR